MFASSDKPLLNRVGYTDGAPAIARYRIVDVTTDTGEIIVVSYSSPSCPTTRPTPWANHRPCFPVDWAAPYQAERFWWFNKYVVTEVHQQDTTGASEGIDTYYRYVGQPAWHYDDNETVDPGQRTWGQWRGYSEVETLTGTPPNPQTLTTTLYYQGMNGDADQKGGGGSATVSVGLLPAVTVAGAPASQPDLDQLAGDVRETVTYDYAGGPAETAQVSDYWVSAAKATRDRSGLPPLTANYTESAANWSATAVTADGKITWPVTASASGYDTQTGLPVAAQTTYGEASGPAQVHCVSTTYAPANTRENLVGLVAGTLDYDGACSTGGSTSDGLGAPLAVTTGDIVSQTHTYYDLYPLNRALGSWPPTVPAWPQTSIPTIGNVSLVLAANDPNGTGNPVSFQLSAASIYDGQGRIVDSYDPLGHRTTVTYTPASGFATTTRTTNPLGQATTKTYSPAWGVELTSTDPNGNETAAAYDPDGRIKAEWNPGEPTRSRPNLAFTYVNGTPKTAPAIITTTLAYQTNGSSPRTTKSVTIYDSLGRAVETQSESPIGGSDITETLYDSHGWAYTKISNVFYNKAPSARLRGFPDDQVNQETVTSFDGLGRAVSVTDNDDGRFVSESHTIYTGDATTTIPPAGGIAETTVTNSLGETTETDQYSTVPTLAAAKAGDGSRYAHTTTSYTFSPQGKEATLADPMGAVWDYTYDLAGDLVSETDPDQGTTTSTYNLGGDLTSTTNSADQTVSYTYDQLGRVTAEYDGPSDTSPIADRWSYDTARHGIGELASSTSYADGNAYTETITGYSPAGASTGETVTIPASAQTLAGKYSFGSTYDNSTGLQTTATFPANGGLPPETVYYNYTTQGQIEAIGGEGEYALPVSYTYQGQVENVNLGYTEAESSGVTYTYNENTGLLDQARAATDQGVNLADTTYTYDKSGNILTETNRDYPHPSGSAVVDTQCFDYDNLDQLTTAWSSTDNCATNLDKAGATNTTVGGPAPYWESYKFNADGERTSDTSHAVPGSTSGNIATGYTYPSSSTAQPHTLTSTVTTDNAGSATTTYGYNSLGLTASITGPTEDQKLGWNQQGELTTDTVTVAPKTADDGDDANIYDASGNLLLAKTPTGTTLYLPDEQLQESSRGTVEGIRYYSLPGGIMAVRTGSSVCSHPTQACVYNYYYELTDQHGTATAILDWTSAKSPTLRAASYRYTDPYGNPRGTTTAATTDGRGFLNDPTNTTTDLTDIGARYYNAATGRFISDDPDLDPGDPQSLNGYTYADDNPNTQSDPSGDMVCEEGTDVCGSGQSFGQGGTNAAAGSATYDQDQDYWAYTDDNYGNGCSQDCTFANQSITVYDGTATIGYYSEVDYNGDNYGNGCATDCSFGGSTSEVDVVADGQADQALLGMYAELDAAQIQSPASTGASKPPGYVDSQTLWGQGCEGRAAALGACEGQVAGLVKVEPLSTLSILLAAFMFIPWTGVVEAAMASGAEVGPTLFRGTSEGYPGSAGTQAVGITPASTDPGVATAFATYAEQFGNGVVQIASPEDLTGVKTVSGYLSYESEVGVELSPAEFAERAGTTVSAAQARELMGGLGVGMPGSFASAGDLADYLQNEYPGLNNAQIEQFIAGAGG